MAAAGNADEVAAAGFGFGFVSSISDFTVTYVSNRAEQHHAVKCLRAASCRDF